MFGYKIVIFKKKKGIEIAPEKEVKVNKCDDPEYLAWKKAEDEKNKKEFRDYNRELINKFIKEKIDELIESYKYQVPQPFQIGEEVTFRYYGPNGNPYHIGYYGGPSTCAKTFNAPDLDGPFTFPVHKIEVSTEFLQDKLRDYLPWYDFTEKYTEFEAERVVNNAWNSVMKIQRNYIYWVEWIIDFDWETLKIPAGTCANEEGWLHLRWGGFNVGHFINGNSLMAKKQRALWKKEKAYKLQKAKFEEELTKLKNDFETSKSSLF